MGQTSRAEFVVDGLGRRGALVDRLAAFGA